MRTNWSKQSQRIYEYVSARPGEDIPAPVLNRVGAGDGVYVASFTKRISEVRARLRDQGCDLVLSVDFWADGQRRTAYRMVCE